MKEQISNDMNDACARWSWKHVHGSFNLQIIFFCLHM